MEENAIAGNAPVAEDTLQCETAPQANAGTSGEPAPESTPLPQGPKGKGGKPDPGRMGRLPIGKLLFEFSLPAIVSMIISSLYNVIDTAVLGWAVGPDGVAVTTLALPVMILLAGCSMLAGVGGNALAALELGAGHLDKVEKTLGNTTVLLVAISAVVALVAIILINPVLTIIGTTPTLWDQTKVFVQIVCIGCVFQSLGNGLNNFLRTAAKPIMATVTQVVGTIMCIIFNILFVMVMGFGVAGSAFATILGQACGGAPVLWYFLFSKNAPFRLKLKCMAADLRLMGKICGLGMASFIMQCASTVVAIVLNQVVNVYGAMDPLGVDNGLAAIGVAQKAGFFGITPIIGLTMGMQPIVGFNFGAKKWDRVIKTLKWSIIDGCLIGLFFWTCFHLWPTQVVNLFGVSGDLEAFTARALTMYSFFLPLVGGQIVAGSYFQSSGQPAKASILELIRQVLFLIPAYLILPGILLSIFPLGSLEAVVVCSPICDILAVVVTLFFLAVELRKLFAWRAEMERPQA